MKDHHMDPMDAIKAHTDLNSQFSVGIHFETFQLTDEGFDEPRMTFNRLWNEASSTLQTKFIAPEFGKTYTISPIGKGPQ
jgi:L-ascorbate metabolism protein UlaG (beta-lactamase superfamily)